MPSGMFARESARQPRNISPHPLRLDKTERNHGLSVARLIQKFRSVTSSHNAAQAARAGVVTIRPQSRIIEINASRIL